MINIPISLIKELRDRTNAGVMECKQTLINSNGNIQLAISNMRKKGTIKVAKKSGRITKEGSIFTKVAENRKYGIILEINCETDFVKNNKEFKKFGNTIANIALNNKITDINTLRENCEEEKNLLISILDENIVIQRMIYIEGEIIGSYLHNNKKIGVIVSFSGKNLKKEELLNHIAMHVAANKPEYIDSQHIPEDILNNEKEIQMSLAKQDGKSCEIAKMITQGRVNKFINEISLINQPFIMNTKKTIMNILHENHIKINYFVRFEVGEQNKNT